MVQETSSITCQDSIPKPTKLSVKTQILLKVSENVADIEKMKDINQYAHDVITKQKNEEFTGRYVNRKLEREDIEEEENIEPNQNQIEEEQYDTQAKYFMNSTETNREKKIRIFKLNSSKILHERNKYVFLASVAERAISLGEKLSDVLGFVLIKKLFKMLCYLRYMLQQKVENNS